MTSTPARPDGTASPPLDRLQDLLPPMVRRVVERDTPIPSIALRAAALSRTCPTLVRADIGQISSFAPELEVLYGPPVGLEALREAIAETWNLVLRWKELEVRDLPGGLTAAHVALCTGAAEGLSLLFRCFAFEKRVGLPRGHWENYTNGVELAGGEALLVDYFDARGDFNAEGLRQQIAGEKIGLLVANFPCNPTGAVLDARELALLARVLEDTGIPAIADEVYLRLRYDGQPPLSLLTSAPGHAVAVGSASKEYLLPGARVGYVLSARQELTDKVLRKLIRAQSASPGVLGQQRLLELLGPELQALRAGMPAPLLTRVREELARRRDTLVEVLTRHGFPMVGRANHRPEGTIFLMAGLPAWWRGSDVEFSQTALEAGCVSVIPGSAFALPGSLRFSYGGLTPERIRQLDRNLEQLRTRLSRTAE